MLAEAYGPVVLKPQGVTWRSKKSEGGGSLYDYAAHPLNLVNWYFGEPERVAGTVLNPIFSRETDDEVYGTLFFPGSVSGLDLGQLERRVAAQDDDQDHDLGHPGQDLRRPPGGPGLPARERRVPDGLRSGWNVKYTTELTDEVWFYVRGEEYSAQVDAFAKRIASGDLKGVELLRQRDRDRPLAGHDGRRRDRPAGADVRSRRSPTRTAGRPRRKLRLALAPSALNRRLPHPRTSF